MPMFPSPEVLAFRAPTPKAWLLPPVQVAPKALYPKALFPDAVVALSPAKLPTNVFCVPVVTNRPA